jgi:hypothetical protein
VLVSSCCHNIIEIIKIIPIIPLSFSLVRFIRTLELFDILSEAFDYIPLWCDLKIGPATLLTKEAKTLKEKLKRAFSSYKSLSKVLAKYSIDSNDTDIIPLFLLQSYEIENTNEHFKQCIAKILVRLKNYRISVVDSLEAMRNKYVMAILHSAINITRDAIGKEVSMRLEYEVIGKESFRRVDYVIKVSETYLHFFYISHTIAILMPYFILSPVRMLKTLFAVQLLK